MPEAVPVPEAAERMPEAAAAVVAVVVPLPVAQAVPLASWGLMTAP